ncbi:hypothetical protein AGABI1DRAFT_105422 [Agaricus bisporus var. burnettii JB137-S8]|uniref:Uncharacterized protein n=1 Tax=Agaricus bisporus var. burnettii (strain JB137-S8 / ATCC MYA-4627 / FGSC 10392) TaxID=597362 RepID=K5XF82_AGABU|nr:uncharacterized protein AGABI1DRAFT_105422 [Agaricus bisporus var. burnettii JB137-S8]EKM82058.1 hypothetical protein AGABI1DRAFT_105422 [Agaricus bisporus var. burnettii JB137-S8]
MIVSFPFTFTFSYPGLPNPFSPNYGPPESHSPSRPMLSNQVHTDQTTPRHSQGLDTMPYPQNRFATLTSPPHTASTIVSKPPNLKRGWEPAFVEPSRLTATLASSNGYLDTPAKYREIASAEPEHDQPEDLPPVKKRRGLADSIVSTAVNAALIGSAVGYTVYRLWRDRGKEQPKAIAEAMHTNTESSPYHHSNQFPPPPPYQEREWIPGPPAEVAPSSLPTLTPRRKIARHSMKRSARRARVPRAQTVFPSPPRVVGVPQPVAGPSSHPQPEFDFGGGDGEEGEDNQMNWISDKLAQLIEEGKRALNREIVVMSDAKEDEIDDGSDAWEEDEDPTVTAATAGHTNSSSRSNSMRRGIKRSRSRIYGVSSANSSSTHVPLPLPISISPQHHQQQQQYEQQYEQPLSTPMARKSHMKAYSTESATRYVSREDDGCWESPEMRETMRRARERALASRGTS